MSLNQSTDKLFTRLRDKKCDTDSPALSAADIAARPASNLPNVTHQVTKET